MKIADSLLRLFFPDVCPVCSGPMSEGSSVICTECRWEIPLTGYWAQIDNPVAALFWGHLPVVQASAFFFFADQSRFRSLVHRFKYHGGWKLALQMGRWYGSMMASGGLYRDVDVVMPVPLHFRRRLRRGYNQSEYIARGIAEALGKPLDTRSVMRHTNNPSQTHAGAADRWDNVEGIFRLRRSASLDGKHILLVDDVLTTGATLVSCGETIARSCPSARISVAALAVSRKGLGVK